MSDLSSLQVGTHFGIFDSLEARFESRGLTGIDGFMASRGFGALW